MLEAECIFPFTGKAPNVRGECIFPSTGKVPNVRG
jgi:hypothetical protein